MCLEFSEQKKSIRGGGLEYFIFLKTFVLERRKVGEGGGIQSIVLQEDASCLTLTCKHVYIMKIFIYK